jgi:endonuclease YncB( thermonuclease family)
LAGVDTSILRNPGKKGEGFTTEGLRYLSRLFAKAEVRIEEAEISPDPQGKRVVYLYVIEKVKKIASEPSPFAELVVKETLVNQEIILRGYAKWDRHYRGRYAKVFELAEREAKLNSQGWWRR